jgi:hypothetical protein
MNVAWTAPSYKKLNSTYFISPTNLYDELKDIFNEKTDLFLCPAFNNYVKNIFVLRSPVNFTIKFDKKSEQLIFSEPNYFMVGEVLGKRMFNFTSFAPIFLCDEPLTLEALPAFFHKTDAQKKLLYTPGTFSIHNWVRPVLFGGFVISEDDEIIIKRNDPLLYIKFVTDEKVNLIHKPYDLKIEEVSKKCLKFKSVCPHKNLNFLYDKFKEWYADIKWLK